MTVNEVNSFRVSVEKSGNCQEANANVSAGSMPGSDIGSKYLSSTNQFFAMACGDQPLNISPINSCDTVNVNPRSIKNLDNDPNPVWDWSATPTQTSPQGRPFGMRFVTGFMVRMPGSNALVAFANPPQPLLVTVNVQPKTWRQTFLDLKWWILGITAVLAALVKLLQNAEAVWKMLRRLSRRADRAQEGSR
jgi:hypothetical protein